MTIMKRNNNKNYNNSSVCFLFLSQYFSPKRYRPTEMHTESKMEKKLRLNRKKEGKILSSAMAMLSTLLRSGP